MTRGRTTTVPARKRKVNYPVAKTATKRESRGADPNMLRQGVVAIDLTAGSGKTGLRIGQRVRINGTGLYAGESAVIERFTSGAIPAAFVRTSSGGTRQARTVDLEAITDEG